MTGPAEQDKTAGGDGVEETRMPTRTKPNAAVREAVRRRTVVRRPPRPPRSPQPDEATDGATVVNPVTEAEPATEATVTEVDTTEPETTEATAPEATATEATATDGPAKHRGHRTRATRRRPRLLVAGLVVVLVAAIAAAVAAGYGWYAQQRLDDAHQQALATARQTTVNFVSVSAATVDRDLKRVTDGATGDFKDEFSRGASQVRAAVVENNVDSRGTVLRSALVSGDGNSAVVLVAIDATVKNVNAPQGRPAHYRIQVNMIRDAKSGRWLVSKLQFAG